jgi:hypothetical protein
MDKTSVRSQNFKTYFIGLALIILPGILLSYQVYILRVYSQDDVDVVANVSPCTLELTVHPERRIPPTGNWSTALDVEIYSLPGEVYEGTVTGTSNAQGTAVFDLCSAGITVTSGDYDFYVKGFSHLRRLYSDITAFNQAESSVDLSGLGDLFAGETSNVYDNVINSLDVSSQIGAYQDATVKYDLNRDGQVNVLDLSNTIRNYFLSGDCSPQEQLNGICN